MMKSKVKVLVVILIIIGGIGLGYYLGYSTCLDKNSLSRDDFNGTFSTMDPKDDPSGSDQVYVSVSPYRNEYEIFLVDSEKLIAKGKCTIDDNAALLESDGRFDVLVFTNGKFYWIAEDHQKYQVWKVGSGPRFPEQFD